MPKQGPKPKENPRPKPDPNQRKEPPAKREVYHGHVVGHSAGSVVVKWGNGSASFSLAGARVFGRGKAAGERHVPVGQVVDVVFLKEKNGRHRTLEVVILEPAKGHAPRKEKFTGMIARHNATTIVVKHANGAGEGFDITRARVVGKGKGAGQTQYRKGQVVEVYYVKKKDGRRKALEVVITAPPNGPEFENAKGPPFVGVVHKVVTDKFGDTGKLWVKGEKDRVIEFRVTNETYIYYKDGNRYIDHTLQGVARGQKVHVKHFKHDAVRVDVIKK